MIAAPEGNPHEHLWHLSYAAQMLSEAFVRTGRLTFDRVSFAYPSRPQTAVLRGVSFGAEPGRVCAVVGASGAGKSTLFHLLQVTSPPLSRAFELS